MSPIRPIDKPNPASPVHGRLREATHLQHEALERRSNVLGRIVAPDARRTLVEGFHRLHASLEPGLARWLDDVESLDFEERRRAPWLVRDLEVLAGRVEIDPAAPAPGSRLEALGWLYVLEGSTLGGRVIRKQVAASDGGMDGLGFLDPYGARQGERWKSFLAVLEREARSEGDVETVVAGARNAFRYAEACLAEPRLATDAADV